MPGRMVKSIVFGSLITYELAIAGLRFRFLSHSIRDSYIGSCAVRVIVRIAPYGAM